MSFREVPIGSVFSVVNGATPASNEPRNWEGDIPWVGPADLGKLKSKWVAQGARSITELGYRSCGTQMVPAGSIIMSTRAPIGHIAIARGRICFNQGCRALIPGMHIRSDFGYWALASLRDSFIAAGKGTTFLELSRDKLRSAKIPLPDIQAQKSIAEFLDRATSRIDHLIEKKSALCALLSQRRHAEISARINSALWPSTKLKRLSTHPITNGVGEAAEFDDSSWPRYVRITDIATPTTLKENVFKSLPPEIAAKSLLKDGDILFAAVGASYGKSYLHRVREGKFCYAGFLVRFRAGVLVSPEYISLWAQSSNFWEQLEKGAVQSTIQNFSAGKYRNLEVPLPPRDEQDRIVSELGAATHKTDRLIDLTQQSIRRLQEYRSSLIAAAVAGEIDFAAWKGDQSFSDNAPLATEDAE